jgi:hypothetical protein
MRPDSGPRFPYRRESGTNAKGPGMQRNAFNVVRSPKGPDDWLARRLPSRNLEVQRERILSLWGAICTASKPSPDGGLVRYWTSSIAVLGQFYVLSRDE